MMCVSQDCGAEIFGSLNPFLAEISTFEHQKDYSLRQKQNFINLG